MCCDCRTHTRNGESGSVTFCTHTHSFKSHTRNSNNSTEYKCQSIKQHRCVLFLPPLSLSGLLFSLTLCVRSSRQCVALRCDAFRSTCTKRRGQRERSESPTSPRSLSLSLRDRCASARTNRTPAIVFGRHTLIILRVCAALSGRVCVSVGPRFHTSYTPTHSRYSLFFPSVCFSFISIAAPWVSSRALVHTHYSTSSSNLTAHVCL